MFDFEYARPVVDGSSAQGLVAVFAYVAFLATAFLQGWS